MFGKEKWKDISEFDGWEISTEGRVRNKRTEHIIKPRVNQQGISMVNFRDEDGRLRTRALGLLVIREFQKPHWNENFTAVIHLNGDKTDCTLSNLMWRPRWFAVKYHRQFKQKPHLLLPVRCVETDEVFPTLRDACATYGLLEEKTYRALFTKESVWPVDYRFDPL